MWNLGKTVNVSQGTQRQAVSPSVSDSLASSQLKARHAAIMGIQLKQLDDCRNWQFFAIVAGIQLPERIKAEPTSVGS